MKGALLKTLFDVVRGGGLPKIHISDMKFGIFLIVFMNKYGDAKNASEEGLGREFFICPPTATSETNQLPEPKLYLLKAPLLVLVD